MEESMRKIAMVLVLGTLIFSPGIALADDDNAALAEQYRGKAMAAQAEARLHESMAKSYRLGNLKGTQVAQMQAHCGKIARGQKELAAEYEALAKGHEEASKNP
jgi:hypothetical protein